MIIRSLLFSNVPRGARSSLAGKILPHYLHLTFSLCHCRASSSLLLLSALCSSSSCSFCAAKPYSTENHGRVYMIVVKKKAERINKMMSNWLSLSSPSQPCSSPPSPGRGQGFSSQCLTCSDNESWPSGWSTSDNTQNWSYIVAMVHTQRQCHVSFHLALLCCDLKTVLHLLHRFQMPLLHRFYVMSYLQRHMKYSI